MKLKIGLSIFVAVFGSACTADDPKYSVNDCITPTDVTYSWYGKYARVETFSKIDGYPGKNYVITFPSYASNSSIFSTDIESHTKKVNAEYCVLK